MTEATSDPLAATVDPQDPLPESNWLYRRIFVFILTTLEVVGIAIIMWMLYQIAKKLGTINAARELVQIAGMLTHLGYWIIGVSIVDRILYMIAPSAEQATKMIASMKMAIEGVVFRQTQTATTTADKASATTTSSVEKPSAGNRTDPASGGVAPASGGTASKGVDSIPAVPPSQR